MAINYPIPTPSNAIYGDNWMFTRSAVSAYHDRLKRMQQAWNMYRGLLDPPLRRKLNAPDDNITTNLGRVIVDKGVSYLFGRGIGYNLDNDETRSPDEKYLDRVWTFNDRDAFLHKIAINGGVCGTAFVKFRLMERHPRNPGVRLLVLDPAKVNVETALDDHTHVMAYEIRWDGIDRTTQKPTLYRQVIERRPAGVLRDGQTDTATDVGPHWSITDQFQQQTALSESGPKTDIEERWVTYNTEVWPFEFAPIAECQNLPNPNGYWGVSDLEPDIVHLNQAVNRVLSNTNRIIRLHAHPKTWTTGMNEANRKQFEVDPDGVMHLPGEAKIGNLEMQSDLASSIEFYVRLRESLYELSRVPEIAFGKGENLAYLSAMAMQILYGPLIEKTNTKRVTYGGLLVEINRRLLEMAGRMVGANADNRCTLIWPEVLPRDAQVEAQTAQVLAQLGVSTDTLLDQLGFDPLQERGLRKLDQAEQAQQAATMAVANAAGQTEGANPSNSRERPGQGNRTPGAV